MSHSFGGIWTHVKLDVLEKYLTSYSLVFKNQDWCHLIYIDAFAGTGECNTADGLIDGSAKIALNIDRFDEFIFIELDKGRIKNLEGLKQSHPDKKITIIHGDCNNEMLNILKSYNWKTTRALSFLDPYKMELAFSTLEDISLTKSIDVWYLFPLSQSTRAMRKDGLILESDRAKLNNLFGDIEWENDIYRKDLQMNFLDENRLVRSDQSTICHAFKRRLEKHFGYVSCPLWLMNTKSSPLFLLYFLISNNDPKAIKVGKNISNHLIKKSQTYVCNCPAK